MVDRKDAEELLDSIRLAYSAEHEYVEVDPDDFKYLDLKYYDKVAQKLFGCGFRFLADVEDLTLSKACPRLRAFVRSMVSHDGTIMAGIYHMKALGWWRIPVWLGLMKNTKALDLETEFTNGCFICTSNAIAASAMTLPPEIETEYFAPKMSTEELLEIHKQRVRNYFKATPGIACVRACSLEDAIASQCRMDALKSAYRDQIQGGLLPEEMDQIAGKVARGIAREALDRMQELDGAMVEAWEDSFVLSLRAFLGEEQFVKFVVELYGRKTLLYWMKRSIERFSEAEPGCDVSLEELIEKLHFCPVHDEKLVSETFDVIGGKVPVPDGYSQACQKGFPFGTTWVGLCVHPHPEKYSVEVCKSCQKAAREWLGEWSP